MDNRVCKILIPRRGILMWNCFSEEAPTYSAEFLKTTLNVVDYDDSIF